MKIIGNARQATLKVTTGGALVTLDLSEVEDP
jgi:hypothetical protein